jgi:hypothetical protein
MPLPGTSATISGRTLPPRSRTSTESDGKATDPAEIIEREEFVIGTVPRSQRPQFERPRRPGRHRERWGKRGDSLDIENRAAAARPTRAS